MPSIINATTTNGLSTSADNSGSLQLATNNGTTAVTIDTSQNVGIGTTSPATKLHVNGNILNVAGNIFTDTTSGLFFSGANNSFTNGVYGVGVNNIAFTTANSERMRITSDGKVLVGGTTAVYPGSSTRGALEINGSAESILSLTIGGSTTNSVYIYNTSSQVEYYSQGTRPVVWNLNGTERMRIDSSGNLLVGTTSQIYGRFNVSATSGAATFRNTTQDDLIQIYGNQGNSSSQIQYVMPMFFGNTTLRGGIYWNGSSIQYNTTSDYRLKENIAPMTGALAKVQALKPCTYTWKETGSNGQGFIAHELQELVPEAVTGEKDAVDADGNILPQSVDTSFLVATLTAALQELNAKVEQQAAEISALKNQPAE